MLQTRIEGTAFKPPRLFFALTGQTNATAVIKALQVWSDEVTWEPSRKDTEFRVFDSMAQIQAAFADGYDPNEAVVVFDGHTSGRFTYAAKGRDGTKIPNWASGTQWGVAVGSMQNGHARNCAQQVFADFQGQNGFEHRVNKGHFPWGERRKGETPPQRVKLPELTAEILERLQMGPNMLEGAHGDFVRELPVGSRISWIRVPGEIADYPRDKMERRLTAVAAFERASCAVLTDLPEVESLLLSGVHFPDDRVHDCYLHPRRGNTPVTEWSVRRPDMHVCGTHLVASENDEMPGGFTDLFHVDQAYGLHQEEWTACLTWLNQDGPLVFVVSSDWSAVYINTTRWLVDELRGRGYDTHLVTTDELDRLQVTDNSVLLDGERVGTIWRQFPVFETEGMLADLVLASQAGKVRMVPEFAHFGNKSWFALFHRFHDAFARHMSRMDFETLRELIPESHLVVFGNGDFPCSIGKTTFADFETLRSLQKSDRDGLVLKVTGANPLSARSLGVLVGAAQSETTWREWLLEREKHSQPFIVQRRFDTSVEQIAVMNTRTRAPEIFRCRVLLRPWVVGGALVSSHNCATPHYTTKIHGMVDMAVQPVAFI